MTHNTFAIIRGTVLLVFVIGAAGWLIVHTVRKADDPARMIFKWILTVGMLVFLFGFVGGVVQGGGYAGAFVGIPLTAACGLVLAIIWRHSIAGLIAKPFASLYDGGDEEPDPRPAYSVAQARQKQGKYLEAAMEVQKQLDRFPTDVEGNMLLAQIQAENLNDLDAAERTIERFCAQPGHATENVVFALYSMADWQLAVGKDQAAAQRSLQKIIDLFPESEFALGAAHRIAHLGDPEMMLDPHDRKKFAVQEGEKSIGLLRDSSHLKPADIDPEQKAAELVAQLEKHPQDTEARENLAKLYVDYYGRIDLATDQLTQMIEQPNAPARLVARWLNILADLQVRAAVDYDTVKETLEKIIELDPKAAAAEMARNRIALLKLEFKAREAPTSVKMGTYEKNVGLKQPDTRLYVPRYRPPR